MKKLLIFICCAALLSCGHKDQTKDASSTENIVATDATSTDVFEENAGEEALNDIRFAGWGKAEWIDNEYIRTVENISMHTTMVRLQTPSWMSTRMTYMVNS